MKKYVYYFIALLILASISGCFGHAPYASVSASVDVMDYHVDYVRPSAQIYLHPAHSHVRYPRYHYSYRPRVRRPNSHRRHRRRVQRVYVNNVFRHKHRHRHNY